MRHPLGSTLNVLSQCMLSFTQKVCDALSCCSILRVCGGAAGRARLSCLRTSLLLPLSHTPLSASHRKQRCNVLSTTATGQCRLADSTRSIAPAARPVGRRRRLLAQTANATATTPRQSAADDGLWSVCATAATTTAAATLCYAAATTATADAAAVRLRQCWTGWIRCQPG